MRAKKGFLLLFILYSALTAAAQTGAVSGQISTADGKAAEAITVTIQSLKKGTTTDAAGHYSLKNIKPGNYTIGISAVGIATQEKEIVITGKETVTADFVISETAKQLEAIIVNTHIQLASKNAVTGVGKMPLTNLENPQVYSTISSAILKQQAIVNYDDAMRNVPGITRTWGATGRAGDGASYFALRGFDAQPSLYSGIPGLTNGNLDPANIEEIQVIKGPSGTLYGGSMYAYGGMINTVTKKPYFDFGGEAAYNVGSFGLHRVTGDVNIPIGTDKNAAFRLNTAYHTEKTFQDAGFRKSFFLAPSFAYKPGKRLTLQVLAEIMQEERAVPSIFFHTNRLDEMTFKTVDELNLDPKLSFISDDLTIDNPRFNVQAQALYELSSQWNSQTVVSYNNNKSKGYYTYVWEDITGDNYFSQYFHKANFTLSALDIQQNFNGDFTIGGLRNRVLIGLDFLSRRAEDNGSAWAWGRNVTPQGGENFIEPYSQEERPPITLTRASIDNLLAGEETPPPSSITSYSYSAYASDVLNITPRLSAMLSLRADYFDNKGEKESEDGKFGQWALSPKFGVIYQPVLEKISLFVNYMNGFINVAPQQVYDKSEEGEDQPRGFQSFKPEHAEQIELGSKLNLFSGKLFATVSAYDIKVKNRVSGDQYGYSQKGEVGSKGFEFDLTATPAAGLNIIAGYSFNETKVLKGDETDFYAQPGRAPGGQGPQHLTNIWGNYKFVEGTLKGFGLGLGGNYASKYKVVDNSATGVFNLPDYALLNGGVSYEAFRFRIAFNMNNITNTKYYIGYWSVNPQAPRNFVASLSYRF